MSLEKLLDKIEKDAQEEIEALRKEHSLALEKIDSERKEKVEDLKKEKREELERERKRILDDYEKEKEFQLKMELLEMKKNILEDAASSMKKEVKEINLSRKKEIFRKKAGEAEKVNGRKFLVFVPSGKKKEMEDVFKDVPKKNIVEKKIGEEEGFVIEGKNFIFKVTLSDIVDEAIEKEKDFFARLLFKR